MGWFYIILIFILVFAFSFFFPLHDMTSNKWNVHVEKNAIVLYHYLVLLYHYLLSSSLIR